MAIELPEKCLRQLDTCEPFAQIVADNAASFICMGENDGTERVHKQDCYTMCWKNSEVDEIGHWDKRDLTDTASVILQGLSIIENRAYNDEE